MEKNKPYGDRLRVEKILVDKIGVEKKKEFLGTVIITGLGCGEKIKDGEFKIGDKLLVSGVQEMYSETYVLPTQIIRRIDE